ncbi:VanW family protein [Thermoanaerobacterium xylanolyticum LX-11]|uniref:VanW family protein n=1 Tax=Thermoanaerobacterium xylanolyticum (strain ATCC 49914 / DSM 7097 / LX-11) TaxID=858215 RepID=F6BJ17_THEXL|nr:VanW domain-containing protein [Thermoanaerobacterium xylanolyticum]AEF16849.1 VanW family protein [Thermoanaerobacterium xylanolyticum LX-11]
METKDTKSIKSKSNYFYIILLILIITVFAGSFVMFYSVMNQNTIAKGVFVNGISLSGLTKSEANSKLQDNLKTVNNLKVVLKYNDKQFVLPSDDVKIGYDYDAIVNEAYSIGKSGNFINRIKTIYNISKNGKYLKYSPIAVFNGLDKFLMDVSKNIDKKPVDAKIYVSDGKINITNDISGLKVDANNTIESIKSAVNNAIMTGDEDYVEVPITVKKVDANIKASELGMIKGKIVSFSTQFNTGDANRSENLAVAAKAVNGKLLMPGQVFSLNKTLGPRIIQNGYKEAPVIIGNKLVPDIGGGVCQVATTIYNAALRADMKIDERYHHTFPVGYVSPGQDATISGDVLDLKFENPTKYPIYIESYISGNNFVVNFYGYPEDPWKRIDIYSEIVEKYEPKVTYVDDPTLPEGVTQVDVEKHTGYKVNTYRLIYENNVLVKKEFLYTDIYKPVDGVIRRGVKKDEVSNNESVQSQIDDKNVSTEDLNGKPQNINPTN